MPKHAIVYLVLIIPLNKLFFRRHIHVHLLIINLSVDTNIKQCIIINCHFIFVHYHFLSFKCDHAGIHVHVNT